MKKLLLILSLLPFLFASCDGDQNAAQQELIVGAWVFESGTKNGDVEGTELLESLIFDFSDKELSCELLNEMNPALSEQEPYELKDGKLLIGKQFNIDLKEVSKENLLVKFEVMIQGSPTVFDLKFIRQK